MPLPARPNQAALLVVGLLGLLVQQSSAQPLGQYGSDTSIERQADECMVGIQRRLVKEFEPYLTDFQGRVLLFDVSAHTNFGDSILWLGAKKLLAYFGRTPDLLCGMAQGEELHFPQCPSPEELLSESDGQPILILWQAGGNYGDLWPYIQRGRIAYLQELDERAAKWNANVTVIQLPQSVYYRSPEYAQNDSKVLTNFKAIRYVLYSRSLLSQEVVTSMLSNDPSFARYTPDMAFMCGRQQQISEPIVDVLLLLRQDKESAIAGSQINQLVEQYFSSVTYKVTDWAAAHRQMAGAWAGRHNISADLSDIRMQEAIQILGQGKVVVTNRLHAVITSALMHIPVFWFEAKGVSKYNKLTSTRALAFGSVPQCTDENMLSFPMYADTETESLAMAATAAIKYLGKAATADTATSRRSVRGKMKFV